MLHDEATALQVNVNSDARSDEERAFSWEPPVAGAGAIVLFRRKRGVVLATAGEEMLVAPICAATGVRSRGDVVLAAAKLASAAAEALVVVCGDARLVPRGRQLVIGQVDAATLGSLLTAARRVAATRDSESRPGVRGRTFNLLEACCASRGKRVGRKGSC